MLKDTIKAIVLSQKEWLAKEEHEIPREQLKRFSTLAPLVHILTGVRRSGKSTLLKQLMRMHGTSNYFNFEDARTAGFGLEDFYSLEEVFQELTPGHPVFFFDEIQSVPGWERYVRDAADRRKTVILTGSNAQMLSRELGTKLTGRHIDYEVFPFSYTEFLAFSNLQPGQESLASFLTEGGFPAYLQNRKKEMLSTLVSDILIRDIFSRYNLRNQEVYRRILQYLLSNTGRETSFNRLRNAFEIGSATSVMDFLQYLTEAYLVFLVPRYDTSLKVQARNPRKLYAIDQGLVNFSSLSGSPDHGRLLENTVYLQLRRLGFETWYFKGRKECDFIFRDTKGKLNALQVTWQLDVQNELRETSGLLEAMDTLKLTEGKILTFGQEDRIRKDGKLIQLLPVWKWLAEE